MNTGTQCDGIAIYDCLSVTTRCKLFGSCTFSSLESSYRPEVVALNQISVFASFQMKKTNEQTPWSESASELYRPSDRRLSAK
jgi:hypothetical protein